MNINIIIIITIIILLILFLLFYNRFCNKIPFDKELPSLSKSTIQTIFYPTSNVKESILTGTEALNNILNNKLNLSIYETDDSLFQKEFSKKLSIYQSKRYVPDLYIERHTNYISRLFNISKKECLNKYHDRIILAATLDSILTKFQNKKVLQSITHEIISQLHEEGYGQLGYRILNHIFNMNQKKPTYIITPTKKSITLKAWHNNLVIICVSTDILLSKINNPNKIHSLKVHVQFDICKREYLKASTLSYSNTSFTVEIPHSMKHCIIEPITDTTTLDYTDKHPKHSILNSLVYNRDHGIFIANYSMPDPQVSPLSKIEQSTNSIGYNSRDAMSHV